MPALRRAVVTHHPAHISHQHPAIDWVAAAALVHVARVGVASGEHHHHHVGAAQSRSTAGIGRAEGRRVVAGAWHHRNRRRWRRRWILCRRAV